MRKLVLLYCKVETCGPEKAHHLRHCAACIGLFSSAPLAEVALTETEAAVTGLLGTMVLGLLPPGVPPRTRRFDYSSCWARPQGGLIFDIVRRLASFCFLDHDCH